MPYRSDGPVDHDRFADDLHAARVRSERFQQRAQEAVEGEALLPAALEELSTVLEELRVTEEEVRHRELETTGPNEQGAERLTLRLIL